VRAAAKSVRVQREPFERAGSRVEPFAEGTRFDKRRLWHVEIAFDASVDGPLLLGDGRFLGLGLMAPEREVVPGAYCFTIIRGLVGQGDVLDVARALRRAVMARVQATLGQRERLEPFFSGHSEDGAPVRQARSSHLSFAFEPDSRRLLILAPHVVERRTPSSDELGYLRTLDAALEGFSELRAGDAGFFSLSPASVEEFDDALLAPSRVWRTISPYVVTRHAKGGPATEALAADVASECRRLGLPAPRVESSNVRGVPGVGLTGNMTLFFERPVAGPLLLGRTRHLGGGFFQPAEDPAHP
jgi:CRISPR-associated protein Csb2